MEAAPVELAALKRLLAEEPTAFEFFQAVRTLERLSPERAPVGGFGDPGTEAVRFAVNTAYGFPASEIQSLQPDGDGPTRMVVNFLGLTGPQGVLPLHYSQLVAERTRARDAALRDFLDLFHHRILSLFYRAWAKQQVSSGPMETHLLDLLGLGTGGLEERLPMPADALLAYTGLLGPQGRSAVALEELIEGYFQVPVVVEQFVGGWYPLEEEAQCAVGEEQDASTQLGFGALVGDEIWDPQARIRLRIGPLPASRYQEFLPSGRAFPELRTLTEFFVGGQFDVELQLTLARDDVPLCELGDENFPPLGWGTWLRTGPLSRDPDDVVFTLQHGMDPWA
jgi:type VI secretion system protein ImpH